MSTTWEPRHITIGLLEAIVISGVTMVVKLKQILDKLRITQKISAYIENKGSNLQTCAQAFRCNLCIFYIFQNKWLLFWACVMEGMSICHFWWQGGSLVPLCFNQSCPSRCAKVYHMVEENGQREARVGKGVHGFWSQPLQIEHLHENKVHKKNSIPFFFFFHMLNFFVFFFLLLVSFPWLIHVHVQMDFLIMAISFLG